MEFKKYFPYVSIDRPSKKFFIITNDNKKILALVDMSISQKDI